MNTEIYKQKLIDEQKILEEELSTIAIKDPSNNTWEAVPLESNDTTDENDNADRAENYEERSSLVKTLTQRLSDVLHALAKIENNTYGFCEVSKNEIEEDRLMANPAARTCKEHMNS